MHDLEIIRAYKIFFSVLDIVGDMLRVQRLLILQINFILCTGMADTR